jgi:hypothetical protein
MITSWTSYPKILNVGHPTLDGYFDGPVTVEEKIDGSQFSFGVFEGELKVRSKNLEMVPDNPEGMFKTAVLQVKEIQHLLTPGWTYRSEYLSGPSHNTLKYERVPKRHLIVFDISTGYHRYLNPDARAKECERIGLESIPVFGTKVYGMNEIAQLLELISVLGGVKIEGVVCKRYDIFGPDGKPLMAKHVSEAFKEVHGKLWKKVNPPGKGFVEELAERYRAEGRWSKALHQLRDDGVLEGSPRDISNLMKRVDEDIRIECSEEIAAALMKFAMPTILRAAKRGLPDWYKLRLLESQFLNSAMPTGGNEHGR